MMKQALIPISARTIALTIACTLLAAVATSAAPKPAATRPLTTAKDGTINYIPDDAGNRIVDFSSCGYGGGGVPIPAVPARVVVAPVDGDNTSRLQSAINYVASLSPDEHGIRGAVLLQKGKYSINGQLRISTSGVVLRGQGMGEDGTVLIAAGQDRRTLIAIAGVNNLNAGQSLPIAPVLMPAGTSDIPLQDVDGGALKVGQTVLVQRPCTPEWVKALRASDYGGGMGSGWGPNSRFIWWDRTITAFSGGKVTLDAPITNALDPAFGGATISPYTWTGRITNVGVENLRCESVYDQANALDEAHSWIGISFDSARDGWVRQVILSHFASSAVAVFDTASRITVEDCKSLAPISENAGYRRQAFYTIGQQTLFQRCYSEHGRHDFAVGFCAAGPNAFVQCETLESLGDSGPIDSWATGVLFDNVRIDGGAIFLANHQNNHYFAGWSAANSVVWQCNSTTINVSDPPTARNYAFGCWGMLTGNSMFFDSDNFVQPVSLYYGQLAERVGANAARMAYIIPRDSTGESRNPTPEQAAYAIAASTRPAITMSEWVDAAPQRTPISTDAGGAKSFDELGLGAKPEEKPQPPPRTLAVTNGWLTINGQLLVGARHGIKWWRGGIRPNEVQEAIKDGPNPTRYVPGRDGPGLTDNLNQLADEMAESGRVALDYHYGLWYDIRDIDHERSRRPDGDVWPPFYEMPFARSGSAGLSAGYAWDGLTRYDLTKFNPWYWSRLKQFADIADRRGLVLLNQNFFQHNVLEAGAHYASSMWRTANNINNTGFPEPPPYSGDKIIYMAEQFYDETNPTRREIYRNYIRKNLEDFADNTNVIQLTSAEFTGPTHFVQFWLDTIADWEKETGKKPIIALSAPKDVQDAILADPQRAAIVSVIDIRYWWYQPGGKEYAPPGGQNLAPRQWDRTLKPKGPDPAQTLRAVREYRQKFPDKAIMFDPEDGGTPDGWAVLMGGGSLANVRDLSPELRAAIPSMKPLDLANASAGQYALGDPASGYLVYSASASPVRLDLKSADGLFAVYDISLPSGRAAPGGDDVHGGAVVDLPGGGGRGGHVIWLKKKS
jgi:hypothetical protein